MGLQTIYNDTTVVGDLSATGIVYAQTVGPVGLSAITQPDTILTLSEASELLTVNTSGLSRIIIPLDSTTNFPNGSQINIARIGSGAVTVSATPGVFLRSADGRVNLRTTNSTATIIKLSADDWLLFGDIN